MGMFSKFKNFFYLDDEEDQEIHPSQSEQPVALPQETVTKKTKKIVNSHGEEKTLSVINIQSANSLKNTKVMIVEPRVYAEAQDISEHLKNKRAVIVNLQRIDREAGLRIIDFLSGTVYALGGDIQRIGDNIFLCTPDNVEVQGEISNYFYDDI
ncbi:cell division protein SepF [Ureibacillus sp. FSL K6-8385]|uniref:Cell division protein SepF n=1 Tax=Ureibacillus terrenus TaxID=118246 RepID=A0A540V480_9BACL|nr:cell division protein SepF [Ureibacillus terrenus]MED3660327.1 cell division protein SepF [Ureibacillus terrenus]MED3762483.1 cell division protein SepF [Ureibacillus terrenus]TQE91551.1 cell division protein SepF [Ureibacillus terrenus]